MKNQRQVMVVLSFAVLPFQKKYLKALSIITKKPQSELAREAITLLFSEYEKMGYDYAKIILD